MGSIDLDWKEAESFDGDIFGSSEDELVLHDLENDRHLSSLFNSENSVGKRKQTGKATPRKKRKSRSRRAARHPRCGGEWAELSVRPEKEVLVECSKKATKRKGEEPISLLNLVGKFFPTPLIGRFVRSINESMEMERSDLDGTRSHASSFSFSSKRSCSSSSSSSSGAGKTRAFARHTGCSPLPVDEEDVLLFIGQVLLLCASHSSTISGAWNKNGSVLFNEAVKESGGLNRFLLMMRMLYSQSWANDDDVIHEFVNICKDCTDRFQSQLDPGSALIFDETVFRTESARCPLYFSLRSKPSNGIFLYHLATHDNFTMSIRIRHTRSTAHKRTSFFDAVRWSLHPFAGTARLVHADRLYGGLVLAHWLAKNDFGFVLGCARNRAQSVFERARQLIDRNSSTNTSRSAIMIHKCSKEDESDSKNDETKDESEDRPRVTMCAIAHQGPEYDQPFLILTGGIKFTHDTSHLCMSVYNSLKGSVDEINGHLSDNSFRPRHSWRAAFCIRIILLCLYNAWNYGVRLSDKAPRISSLTALSLIASLNGKSARTSTRRREHPSHNTTTFNRFLEVVAKILVGEKTDQLLHNTSEWMRRLGEFHSKHFRRRLQTAKQCLHCSNNKKKSNTAFQCKTCGPLHPKCWHSYHRAKYKDRWL